jgi:hypothetical protein
MSHLTLVLMIVGVLVLALGIFIDVKAHLGNPNEKMAPFRYYCGTEDDRDLLRQSLRYDSRNSRDSVNPRGNLNTCDSQNQSDRRTRNTR